MVIRYYVHGDEVEERPGVFYCARCDLFTEQSHFREDDHHKDGEVDYKRYLSDIKRLPTFMKNTQGRYRRPPAPYNCVG